MRKNIILLTIVMVAFLTSCYDLDRAPFDKPSSSTFWETEDQCKQGVMGVYASLKNLDLFGKMFMIDVNSDVATGYDQYEVLQLGTATPRTGFLNGKWQNGYDAIMRANTAVKNLTDAAIDATKKKQMLGEVKFIRALVYSHLLDYFGGVPLYDESTNLELEFDKLMKTRSSEEQTRTFILKDLIDAANSDLPITWPASDYGRVTKGAVIALRGKVNLFAKNYQNAIDDFEEILKPEYGYKLHPNYAELFNLKGHTSSEMIFAIINLGGIGNAYGMPLCFYAGTRNSFGSCWNNTVPSVTLADMYENIDGSKFNWDDLFPGYSTNNAVKERVWRATTNANATAVATEPAEKSIILEMYSKRDPRMAATIIAPYTQYLGWYANVPKMMSFYLVKNQKGDVVNLTEANGYMRNNKGGWETYFWRKFVPEGNWDGAITDRAHTPVNFPIIRLADVYLMLAEAYNEINNIPKSVENINKVRTRVGMPGVNSGPLFLAANTKEQVFQRIFQERAVELAGEGLRDSDLRRWKLSHLKLNRLEVGITGKTMFTRIFNENRDYLWPIPATEIEINPALTQNTGW